ncbi:helix-turn-helix transcriptional regulator [Mobilitalea sibirica]|uniref:Helix-turn-helix transcriptional regulator n=1 Tax=Mobilitalea sibirica TaxID=1462919 RepID=A0A8J7H0A4_9FIRM|nr:helix-turn-helix transcriptional regulator [Mobilitalea sibirica]MBH1939433.1 helix-turn-helix transcriptional regulator [Mobilitalea sibirica]
MKFSDKLIQIRREKGYSQEQLADLLNVSRQSVSKWEAGQSTPELNKLISIADIFNVTIDNLVREELEVRPQNHTLDQNTQTQDTTASSACSSSRMVPCYWFYEYKSKTTIFGIPLVHIKNGYGMQVAKGIIAIGYIAIGVVSIGGIALGGLCLGGLGLGLIALGGFALGGFSFGGLSLGIIATGGIAVGIYSIGGIALASQVAVGGLAFGETAVGADPSGEHVLKVTDAVSSSEIQNFILEHNPRIWRPLLKLLSVLSKIR